MGGEIALQLVIRHPELVRKQVVVSASYTKAGVYPEVWEALATLPPDVFDGVRPGLSASVYEVLGVANALKAFRSHGSTAPAEVAKQLAWWRETLT